MDRSWDYAAIMKTHATVLARLTDHNGVASIINWIARWHIDEPLFSYVCCEIPTFSVNIYHSKSQIPSQHWRPLSYNTFILTLTHYNLHNTVHHMVQHLSHFLCLDPNIVVHQLLSHFLHRCTQNIACLKLKLVILSHV